MGFSVLVFQDQSDDFQRVDILQLGTCAGEYGLSWGGRWSSGDKHRPTTASVQQFSAPVSRQLHDLESLWDKTAGLTLS